MALLVFVGCLFVIISFGVPIAVALTSCAIILMMFLGNVDPTLLAQQMVLATNNYALMAIPFFMFAGEIMSQGGLSHRLVKFTQLLMGRVNGGLGYAAILASIVFAGLSGSAVADAAALGSILVPLMVKNGYSPQRSTGLICSSGVIAMIIPPSIGMIVLGTSVGISISRLFMAGIIPGIFIGVALMTVWFFVVKKDGYKDTFTFTGEEKKAILKDSLPALLMPVLIIGGIRFGVFTPTEAGAFAAVYALLICTFWYKEINMENIFDICVASVKSTATVMFIVASALAVGWLITVAQIPKQSVRLFGSLIQSPLLLLLVINAFLFVMGMILDLSPNILIFAPMLYPVIKAAGIDPIYFGVLMVYNLTIGLITPPVGTVLFVGTAISGQSLTEVVKGVLPFLIMEIIVLLLMTFFPSIILVPAKLWM